MQSSINSEKSEQSARQKSRRFKARWTLFAAGLFAGGLACLSLASCVVALDKSQTQLQYEKDSTVVAAKVARFDGPTPVVRYAYQGSVHEHRVEGRNVPDGLKPDLEGRNLQVRLLKSDPEEAYVSSWEDPPSSGLGFAGIAGLLAVFSAWAGGRFRRRAIPEAPRAANELA